MVAPEHAGRGHTSHQAASGLGQLGPEAYLLHPRCLLGSVGKSSSEEEALGWWELRLLSFDQRWVLGATSSQLP